MDTDDYILPVTTDGVCQGPTLESGLEEEPGGWTHSNQPALLGWAIEVWCNVAQAIC